MTCRHETEGRALVDIIVDRGGVDRDIANHLLCPDVHMMVRTLARAGYEARTDRRLLLEEYPPVEQALGPARWWHGRGPVALWVASALALIAALWLICSPVWRTFT